MIHRLLVENIALIDKLDIEFSPGLNVLSGETGAGKSIIVGSMNLVLGERADREMIRGSKGAYVEAVMYVDAASLSHVFEEYAIREDEELIVTRELTSSGRNLCRINGTAVNLSSLKGFMNHVVDLVGQHEHQSLLESSNHLKLLDNFGGKDIEKIKSIAAQKYAELKKLNKQISALGGDENDRASSVDLLEFQINEIDEAAITEGELESLLAERELLMNAENIARTMEECYDILSSGENIEMSAMSAIRHSADETSRLDKLGEEFASITERLNECYYQLEDVSRDISSKIDSVYFDEQRQNEVEERISLINSLLRKYGAADEQELLSFAEEMRDKLEKILKSDEIAAELAGKIAIAENELFDLYVKISDARVKVADKLSSALLKELAELGMQDARFEVRLSSLNKDSTVFSSHGPQTLEFYISTNKGEALKPLAKTASGGEISRIMLAFKNVIAKTDSISTMIFDEIDTGISGRMAHTVAEKMAGIAMSRQVICVTHLAQIAAMADKNFLISKEAAKDTVNTRIHELDKAEVAGEIARLSGGTVTQNALSHANELIENAEKIKSMLSEKKRRGIGAV